MNGEPTIVPGKPGSARREPVPQLGIEPTSASGAPGEPERHAAFKSLELLSQALATNKELTQQIAELTERVGERPSEWSRRLDLGVKIAGVLGLFAAVAGLFFTAYQIYLSKDALSQDHDLRRRQQALALWTEWRSVMDKENCRQAVDAFMEMKPTKDEAKCVVDRGMPPTWREALEKTAHDSVELQKQGELRKLLDLNHDGKVDKDDIVAMRLGIVAALNLFEEIAVAHRDNIGDGDIVHDYFAPSIRHFETGLRPFKDAWKDDASRSTTWAILDATLADEWKDPAPRRGKPPTGK